MKVSDIPKPDWFARITAIIGLVIACSAIMVPIYQSKEEGKEALGITAKPEMEGIIRLSATTCSILQAESATDIARAVQIPWMITLSNVGRVTMSVIAYSVEQVQDHKTLLFNGLDGGATDSNNKNFIFPQRLEAGQSFALRLHIGFIPKLNIQQKLSDMCLKKGQIDYQSALVALAEQGVTLYGTKAEFKEWPEGGYLITIDQSSYNAEPVYKISFTSGRGSVFSIITSENPAKLQQAVR